MKCNFISYTLFLLSFISIFLRGMESPYLQFLNEIEYPFVESLAGTLLNKCYREAPTFEDACTRADELFTYKPFNSLKHNQESVFFLWNSIEKIIPQQESRSIIKALLLNCSWTYKRIEEEYKTQDQAKDIHNELAHYISEIDKWKDSNCTITNYSNIYTPIEDEKTSAYNSEKCESSKYNRIFILLEIYYYLKPNHIHPHSYVLPSNTFIDLYNAYPFIAQENYVLEPFIQAAIEMKSQDKCNQLKELMRYFAENKINLNLHDMQSNTLLARAVQTDYQKERIKGSDSMTYVLRLSNLVNHYAKNGPLKNTALHILALSINEDKIPQVLLSLIKTGKELAIFDQQNEDGDTALHIFANKRHINIIRWFLSNTYIKQQDLWIKNKIGKTVYDIIKPYNIINPSDENNVNSSHKSKTILRTYPKHPSEKSEYVDILFNKEEEAESENSSNYI